MASDTDTGLFVLFYILRAMAEIKSNRIVAVDALRGWTVAGMILVNVPGKWGEQYAILGHAEWHGITFADLIFPFFLFVVGISVVLAYSKAKASGAPRNKIIRKVLIRTLRLFALGLALHLTFSLYLRGNLDGGVRFVGVLQRIALVFFAGVVLFLNTNRKQQFYIGSAILVLYWISMVFIPVPGVGTGVLEPGQNFAAWIDQFIVPGKMYQGTWDPEGFWSTFPAIATAISGMLVGHLIVSEKTTEEKLLHIYFGGFVMLLIGAFWDLSFPANKHIWTSSFVLITSGLASLTLASLWWVIDVLGYRKWSFSGLVFGKNAIFAYALHSLLLIPLSFTKLNSDGDSINSLVFEGLKSAGMSPAFASLLWSLIYIGICFLPTYYLYKKGKFLKL
ncbi:MAG: heparan-alpha-glucosaminide N-acetyltransferase domain-containing protein [Bacteroidota bacterium]